MAFLLRLSVLILSASTLILSISAQAKPPKLCYCPCPTESVINLKTPNIDPVVLLNWASTAAVMSFHYDYKNMEQWMVQYSKYFDTRGWYHYYQALKNSGNLNTVAKDQITATSTPLEPPVVLWEGVDLGIYKWRVQIPILVQYRSASGNTIQQKLMVNMTLRRNNEALSQNGIAIVQFVAKPIA